ISGARWWGPVRPVASALAGTLLIPAAAVAATVFFGLRSLYPWARPDAVAASHLLHGKTAWLNPPLFLARVLVVLIVWLALTAFLRDRASSARPGPASALFLVVLAPTLSVASWDLAMSLEPEWFSTMYAVYVFAGSFLGGIAAVALLASALDARGLLPRGLGAKERHDLGKLLFGFATFWAYIWFCQYLLIWYSNIPEETTHYVARLTRGWTALFWLNPVLSFAVPFAALLPVAAKRSRAVLVPVCLVVVAGRFLDAYLLVVPSAGPAPAFPALALAAAALLLLATGALFLRGLTPREEADRPPARGTLELSGS
ncbi:MAG: hypothetical protein DYH06_15640, partial [Acidobacteria bacterium ACB2]|nr:hypothetical protein [Acidobacteria bacterium ACB2]